MCEITKRPEGMDGLQRAEIRNRQFERRSADHHRLEKALYKAETLDEDLRDY